MNLFFYGTLMDDEVRKLVLGPEARGIEICRATLAGFRRHAIRKAAYPVLVPRRGARVAGVLCSRLGPRAVARLDRYEGRDYLRVPVEVRSQDGSICRAHVYLGPGRLASRRRCWSLDEWRRRHGRAFSRLFLRWMGSHGDSGEMRRRRRGVMRARAPAEP